MVKFYNINGDIMDTYHIFVIKKEIYNTYKDNPYSLYKSLYNLYNTNKDDLKLGISIYSQLCNIVNIKKITEYIKLLPIIRETNNKYLISKDNKKAIIILKYSNIIYKYTNINQDILYILNSYSEYLFACNFKKNNYYWIKEKINIEE